MKRKFILGALATVAAVTAYFIYDSTADVDSPAVVTPEHESGVAATEVSVTSGLAALEAAPAERENPQKPGSEETVDDASETHHPFRVVRTNVAGTIEQLLERELAGDVKASYELAARATECLSGLSTLDCDNKELSKTRAFERLLSAAESGLVAAQLGYANDFQILSPPAAELSEQEHLDRLIEYLLAAKKSGSVEAMYWLGNVAVTSADGTDRQDINSSLTGLTRIEGAGHLLASSIVYKSLGLYDHIKEMAELELNKLNPREYEEAKTIADELLVRQQCCSAFRRE